MKRTVHLICNAHLDPVWLWEWEEGAAAAISTFRAAADFCEQFDGFIFNHNEAILYRWVQEYEPALFARIRRQVRRGRWHIMGGWYLQPDCNMPSGESLVRQVLVGKRYFREEFDVDITTAMSFDAFGHSRGLVQILAKSGYDSYLFTRPSEAECKLPANNFIWTGYDGSEVMATRFTWGYNSPLGRAAHKVTEWMRANPDASPGMVLWGVGNHGGGPSRADIRAIDKLISANTDDDIRHSTPEAYFRDLKRHRASLPRHDRDINPFAVGCYTSQVRIKQSHRRLENELYTVEKMAVSAALNGTMAYPHADLEEAQRDLLTSEFHDILPGSSIQPVEATSLRMMDHGMEILSRLKARAFFALSQGQAKAKPGEIPILVFNHHPFPVRALVACEFQLEDQNWQDTFTNVVAYQRGRRLPTQVEKEHSNLTLDWRKRVVFSAMLAPGVMNRFDCRLESLPKKPTSALKARAGNIRFSTADLDVLINTRTGLIDRLRIRGVEVLKKHAFQPLVMLDNEDPWGMQVKSFRTLAGRFTLASRAVGSRISGVKSALPSVRVVEAGAARTVVEAIFVYGDSFICQRYLLPQQGTEIEVEVRVHWNEKDRMLKLSIPTATTKAEYLGQVAYGVADLSTNGDEMVAQKWVAIVDRRRDLAITCINEGSYGSDCSSDGLRLSLLRSSAYSAHPINGRPMVPQDRYTPRIDQGERLFRFWINAGPATARLAAIDREALAKNEKPYALSFFPSGDGVRGKPALLIGDDVVQVPTMKMAEKGGDLVIRLFEPTGRARTTIVSFPNIPLRSRLRLAPFEIVTLRVDRRHRRLVRCDLLERPERR